MNRNNVNPLINDNIMLNIILSFPPPPPPGGIASNITYIFLSS